MKMGEVAVCIDVATDLGMEKESCVSTTELKPELDKKLSKEVTNEDVSSEVLNPLVSTKENASSCQDITSQTTDLAARIGVASLEVSSNCSGDSSPVETLSEEREISSGNNSNTSQSNNSYREHSSGSDFVTKTHVVLEIPEHCRSSGIRKITFKFSKRKEDYDAQAFASAADSPMNGMLRGEEYGRRYHASWIDSGMEMPGATNVYPCLPNMELKMSKKVVADNCPTNVKKLLSTGILDGARVKYIYSPSKRQLDGIIDGGGYLCGCSFCNFSKILSAYEFEQHAGVKTKHPNNHIFLENGKAIYSIIQELKAAPLSTLDEVLREVAGSSINEEFFQQWKASIRQSNEIGADKKFYKKPSSFHASFVSCPSQVSEESLCPTPGPFVQNNPLRQRTYMDASEEQKRPLKRLKPTISSSVAKQKKVADGSKKRLYRDNDLHRLLFMPNGLPDGAELAYYVKGLKLLKGYKQGNGILCGHCNSEISPSQFEAHAGMAARRQPYRHIYTSNGLTLHDIAISLANGQKLNTSVSDGMCSKCGDGGVQVFCKSCSQAFHAACLDLQYVPEGDWHCSDCLKFGPAGNSTGIIVRSTRAVEKPEDEVSGCVICRKPNYEGKDGDKVTEGDAVIILCDQCEKEFHVGCLRDSGICLLEEIPKDEWFCCNDCNKIYWALHDLVSNGIQMIPVPQLNIIAKKCAEKGYSIDGAANAIRWRVLLGKSREQEHRALLSRVAAIFRECFSPIVAANGHDLIPIMVYGRNISGQEFGAMHCVLLTVNNVVVSAGLLRVFGKEVAELPLVATSRGHQGKGYFQALFSCIESLLCSLNVKNLVLPAAEEAESIWTRKFGFKKMSKEQLSKYTREYQLTVFRDTSVLEKEVPRAQ